jgi:hypothetical protein
VTPCLRHDQRLGEEVALSQGQLLPVPVQQIEELRLQGRPGSRGVEVGEERIVGLLENRDGVEPRRESFRERCLPDADRAFDRDVPKRHECGDAGSTVVAACYLNERNNAQCSRPKAH